jgi:hypothetical protein
VQVETTLTLHVEKVRAAHAELGKAYAGFGLAAVGYGRALIEARKVVPKGWDRWLEKSCEVCPRMARRYVELAKAYDESGHDMSGLTGLSMDGLRLVFGLSNQREGKAKGKSGHAMSGNGHSFLPKPGKKATHLDLNGVWLAAPVGEQNKFLDQQGLLRRTKAITAATVNDQAVVASDWKPVMPADRVH